MTRSKIDAPIVEEKGKLDSFLSCFYWFFWFCYNFSTSTKITR